MAALRYVELNPLRAGMVARAQDWRWSSARAHVTGEPDAVLAQCPMVGPCEEWGAFLGEGALEKEWETLRRQTRTGRPWADAEVVDMLERQLGRILRRAKPGPKRTGE